MEWCAGLCDENWNLYMSLLSQQSVCQAWPRFIGKSQWGTFPRGLWLPFLQVYTYSKGLSLPLWDYSSCRCPWLASRWPFGTSSTIFSFPTAIHCGGQKAKAEVVPEDLFSCVSFCSKCATASKIICALDVICYTVKALFISITEAVHYLGPFTCCYFSFQTLDM